MKLLLQWLISALAIIVAAYLIPGVSITILAAFILAVVLGLINITLKPIIGILTLPINILTLGIFSLFVNAALILLAAQVVPNFAVESYWTAFLFSLVLSLINLFFRHASK